MRKDVTNTARGEEETDTKTSFQRNMHLEERVRERCPDVDPLLGVKVEQPADEVAKALAGDVLLGDDGLARVRREKCKRVSGRRESAVQKREKSAPRASSCP